MTASTWIDKHGLLDNAQAATLELGCGAQKQVQGSVGIDSIDYPAVDIVGDALAVMRAIPDCTIAAIHASHFLEHLEDPLPLLVECGRVLQGSGDLFVTVPHFSNPHYYSDPTHRTQFGMYTFSYWVDTDRFRRRVPSYGMMLPFQLVDLKLGFRSDYARLRSGLKKVVGAVINSMPRCQEFYEENLVYLFPCYEIRLHLRRCTD